MEHDTCMLAVRRVCLTARPINETRLKLVLGIPWNFKEHFRRLDQKQDRAGAAIKLLPNLVSKCRFLKALRGSGTVKAPLREPCVCRFHTEANTQANRTRGSWLFGRSTHTQRCWRICFQITRWQSGKEVATTSAAVMTAKEEAEHAKGRPRNLNPVAYGK